MKSSVAAIAALFALAGGQVFAEESHVTECRSETERPLNIMQLLKPIPEGQAVAFLLELNKDSLQWERLRTAHDKELGAILNEFTPEGLSLDPDSVHRLNRQEIFEEMPFIVAHACQAEGEMNVIEVMEALKSMEPVTHAAPDSTLEEIPVIITPVKPGVDL